MIPCGCGICLKCCFDVWCQFQPVGSLGNFYLHFFVLLYKGRKYWPLNRLSSRMMSLSTAPCCQITACRGVGGRGKHSATQQTAVTHVFYSFTYIVGSAPARQPTSSPWFLPSGVLAAEQVMGGDWESSGWKPTPVSALKAELGWRHRHGPVSATPGPPNEAGTGDAWQGGG